MKHRRFLLVLVASLALVTAQNASAGDPVTGAGSTFAEKVINQWAGDVAPQGVSVTYTGTGSGDGRLELINGEVDFAASDLPAPTADADKLKARYGGFVHAVITSAGIAVVYNVPGLTELKLTGPTLAKIFSGTITNWNDPAIALDNGGPGPDQPIKVIVRADKSGSSGVFSGYLEAAGEGNWTGGTTENFPAPANGEGRQGGGALAQAVADTPGAVGYIDHGGAMAKSLAEVKVRNAAGANVGPDPEGVRQAIDEAKQNPDGTLTLTYKPKAAGAYPISTVSYVIAPNKMPAAKHETFKAFLTHGLSKGGQDSVLGLGYAPLSEALAAFSQQQADQIAAG
ncbi:MAG: phosphate ABC transporter substrate-binding protein PstS [Acidimicrobiia bacterium]